VSVPFTLDVGSHTEVGRVRDHNEDSLGIADEIGLFVVADGMGGHQAGERASCLAVEELCDYLQADSVDPCRGETLRSGFLRANESIFRESLEFADRRGMGTTMTALVLRDDCYRIAHVGDSRAWLLRDGSCRQLTDDHSVMGEQLRAGLITPQQAENHPLRNVLTRSLGNLPTVDVDVIEGTVLAGDVFVLGTDGMTRALDERGIAERVGRAADAREAARDLVRYACMADGSDNVTAVVVRCRPRAATSE
jgi:serine/threonine protein phosphatase PrpC